MKFAVRLKGLERVLRRMKAWGEGTSLHLSPLGRSRRIAAGEGQSREDIST